MLSRVKKNDLVYVTAGKYTGKQGAVIAVDRKKKRVLIKNIAIITRHVKPRRQGEKGGIIKEESFIHESLVMPICSSCKKPCRMQTKLVGDNKKARACHRCKEVF